MGQFLKQTFASTIGSIIGLFIFSLLGASGLFALLLIAFSNDESSVVKDKSVLVFDLSLNVKDSQTSTNLSQALRGKSPDQVTLRRVLESIDKAAKDKRVVALLLDGRKNSSLNGYATLAEIRNALEKFQSTGKKIIAYDVTLTERDYYLASIADEIIINPMGMIELNGLSSKQLFFKGALDKYGVGVQVIRVGDYKSAVEPYIRSNLSPANRQQTKALLTDVWNQVLDKVVTSRKLNPANLQAIINQQGYINPQEATKIGLIDRFGYYDDLASDLRKFTGEDKPTKEASFRQIDLVTYADRALDGEEIAANQTSKIAVVYAEGAIVEGEGGIDNVGGDRLSEELRKLRIDESVKAIVLRVNSPGGGATASDVILREVLLTKERKPVIVSMGDVAASGGYWIAAGGDMIFAQENTVTGSIGVFGLISNIQEIANNNGFTWDVVKTSELADMDSNIRPKNAAELAIYQKSVDQTYQTFIEKVAKYRNLPQEKVKQIAQGRVWSGKEAVKIGLVDRIGGLESAIALAAEKAQLGNNWFLEEYPQQNPFESKILEELLKSQTKSDPLTAQLAQIQQEVTILQGFNDPNKVYARLPFNFQID
ncbi:signal peptide peptidase SppA, 67K type [Chondrocystis sp. NIES-4102]|nr:signal peptide peptidase SppA, 67K type [Chondrocystis sp. NIES-4102]